AAIGRSRLIESPAARSPRLVRSRVSPMTSVTRVSPSMDTAVRQTPFTATDAPTAIPSVIGPASMVMARPRSVVSIEATLPRCSTMPVNMPCATLLGRSTFPVGSPIDPQVGAEPGAGSDFHPAGFGEARPWAVDGRCAHSPRHGCRQVSDASVAQVRLPQGGRQTGAAFDHDIQDAPLAQNGGDGAKVGFSLGVGRDLDDFDRQIQLPGREHEGGRVLPEASILRGLTIAHDHDGNRLWTGIAG